LIFTIYILRCSDGSYYTGLTRGEIEGRLWEHQNGAFKTCYTYKRRPVELVMCETFENPREAVVRERQIKGWNRIKKEALIAGDYEALPGLSKNRQADQPTSIQASQSKPRQKESSS